jgi:hypothetical protein
VAVFVGLTYPNAESFLPPDVRAQLEALGHSRDKLGQWHVLGRDEPLPVALGTLYPALRTPPEGGVHVVVISHGMTLAVMPEPTDQDAILPTRAQGAGNSGHGGPGPG